MSQQTPDTVFINSLTIEASIGCLEWEKTILQKVIIDIELDFDCQAAGATDQLTDALDYAAIAAAAKEIASSKHFNLVEHLAQCLAENLLAAFPTEKISIAVTKPQALANVAATGVRMVRYASA